jgi:hypothetical protein
MSLKFHKVKIVRTNPAWYGQTRRNVAFWQGIFQPYLKQCELRRKIAMNDARLEKMNQDREIGETVNAIKSNQLVLLDIQIERAKLELAALKRKLGNPDDFHSEEI